MSIQENLRFWSCHCKVVAGVVVWSFKQNYPKETMKLADKNAIRFLRLICFVSDSNTS